MPSATTSRPAAVRRRQHAGRADRPDRAGREAQHGRASRRARRGPRPWTARPRHHLGDLPGEQPRRGRGRGWPARRSGRRTGPRGPPGRRGRRAPPAGVDQPDGAAGERRAGLVDGVQVPPVVAGGGRQAGGHDRRATCSATVRSAASGFSTKNGSRRARPPSSRSPCANGGTHSQTASSPRASRLGRSGRRGGVHLGGQGVRRRPPRGRRPPTSSTSSKPARVRACRSPTAAGPDEPRRGRSRRSGAVTGSRADPAPDVVAAAPHRHRAAVRARGDRAARRAARHRPVTEGPQHAPRRRPVAPPPYLRRRRLRRRRPARPKRRPAATVSVVLPALDEERTVGAIVAAIRAATSSSGSRSSTRWSWSTAGPPTGPPAVAAAAGARVVHVDDVLPEHGAVPGQGRGAVEVAARHRR